MATPESGRLRLTRIHDQPAGAPGPRKKDPPASSKSPSSSLQPWEAKLDQFFKEAEYEIDVDPYRGVFAPFDKPGPWRRCQCSSNHRDNLASPDSKSEEDQKENAESAKIASFNVEMVTLASCPTLSEWTRDTVQKKKGRPGRKRKRVSSLSSKDEDDASVFGSRPTDPNYRCPCDYNPFCLCTIGGVFNEILLNRRKALRITDDEESVASSPLDPEVMVIESDLDSAKKSNGNSAGSIITDMETLELDPFKEKSIYSCDTLASLKRLRKTEWTGKDLILLHLRKSLQSLASTQKLEECLAAISAEHDTLLFRNPVVPPRQDYDGDEEDRIRLSIPPGILNLGATCYLNTQLQCLAQNRVFVQGILSWKPWDADNGDKMNSVINLFQKLLATMVAGPYCEVNTLEFSNALGLDHYEQQDPNEFSRLFFQRLHESFSAGAKDKKMTEENDGEVDLARLLPHLFQGTYIYETTCLTCKSVSQRTEEFMDLNLPIVHPPVDKDKKSQLTLLDAFSSSATTNVDTDVQYCFNRCFHPEVLEGDNQYWCSKCEGKRDARRTVNFGELPPVLNVQLSRYVFDRTKHEKKKLDDKVLLPMELRVNNGSNNTTDSTAARRYILCAVMRHKGKSAYSGHYVAEAMDWLTGKWYEFNDEKVEWLRAGPSCSYDPGTNVVSTDIKEKRRKSLKTGSQDAYNLYYVDESFLAQSIHDHLRLKNGISSRSLCAKSDAFPFVEHERARLYDDLARMCALDLANAKRMLRRKRFVRESFSKVFDAIDDWNEYIWVDSASLRRFLSCTDRSEDEQAQTIAGMLQPAKHACNHEPYGIHPRVARRGKLLPKQVYEAIVSFIRAELTHADNGELHLEPNLFSGQVASPLQNLFCKPCCEDYREALAGKLAKWKAIRYVYTELGDFPLERSSAEGDDEKFAYLIARKFVTSFRNGVVRFMKRLTSAASINSTPDTPPGLFECEGYAEGVDALDFNRILGKETNQEQEVAEEIDTIVNRSITCSHGKCKTESKRSVRLIREPVWNAIVGLFPEAVQHRKERTGAEHWFDSPDICCSLCKEDDNVKDGARESLLKLVNDIRNPSFVESVGMSQLVSIESSSDGTGKYRILHEGDLSSWKKLLGSLKSISKDSYDAQREAVKEILSPKVKSTDSEHNRIATDANGQTESMLDWVKAMFRPIVCTRHKKPVCSAIYSNAVPGEPPSLSRQMQIFTDEAYRKLIVYAIAIWEILQSYSANEHQSFDESMKKAVEQSPKVESLLSHPAFEVTTCCKALPHRDIFVASSNSCQMLFRLHSLPCDDFSCVLEYDNCQDIEDIIDAEERSKSIAPLGHPAILLDTNDSDSKAKGTTDTVTIRVFEVSLVASTGQILSALATCAGISPAATEPTVRRSSRRKTTRFPVGVILEEDNVPVNLRKNLAVMRLQLLERCAKGSPYELDHKLKLVLKPQSSLGEVHEPIVLDEETGPILDNNVPIIIDLTFDLNSQELSSVCSSVVGDNVSDPSQHIFLLRFTTKDESSADITKESLMDHLIALGNIEESQIHDKKRKGRIEKGFRGTLLSGGTKDEPQTNREEEVELRQNETVELIKEHDAATPSKKHKSDAWPDLLGSISADPSEEGADNISADLTIHLVGEKSIHPIVLDEEHQTSAVSELKLLSSDGHVKVEDETKHDEIVVAEVAPSTKDGSEDAKLKMELFRRLLDNPDIEGRYQSSCWDAVEWALARHSDRKSLEELLDVAYAKYLELIATGAT